MISRDFPADDVLAFTGPATHEMPPERAAVVADGDRASEGKPSRSPNDSTDSHENPAFPEGADSPLPEWVALALYPEAVPRRGIRIDTPAEARAVSALLATTCRACGLALPSDFRAQGEYRGEPMHKDCATEQRLADLEGEVAALRKQLKNVRADVGFLGA